MGRDNAVINVGGGDKDWGIFGAWLNVVQGGIGVEVFELLNR